MRSERPAIHLHPPQRDPAHRSRIQDKAGDRRIESGEPANRAERSGRPQQRREIAPVARGGRGNARQQGLVEAELKEAARRRGHPHLNRARNEAGSGSGLCSADDK